MKLEPASLPQAGRIVALARTDRRAAERALAEASLEEQAAAICEAPLAQRSALLGLVPDLAEVVPLLPEAEFCFTAKAIGLEDASHLLEYATPAQLVAAVDLDAWVGLEPDLPALGSWLSALVESGEEPLLRSAQAIDPELIVLHVRDRVDVVMKTNDDDWEPPVGGQTLEGVFYLVPKRAGDDIAELLRMLDVLFRRDYWLYFRMLQGVVWELRGDLEEWALRWRTGRLQDLGFPAWDEAMRIYGYLRPEQRVALPESGGLILADWQLPVWITDLPAAADSRHAIFRAAAELSDEDRRAFFYAFIGLANKIAIADRMPLGDAGTLPAAIEKGAEVTSRGLELLSTKNGISPVEVLHRADLERLFRVGASLEPRG